MSVEAVSPAIKKHLTEPRQSGRTIMVSVGAIVTKGRGPPGGDGLSVSTGCGYRPTSRCEHFGCSHRPYRFV